MGLGGVVGGSVVRAVVGSAGRGVSRVGFVGVFLFFGFFLLVADPCVTSLALF
jgi:hypothetical protein